MQKQKMIRRLSVRPAFSIVEVLVGVGIVVGLLVLMLPMLGLVRASSRDALCAANLQQLSAGAMATVGDAAMSGGTTRSAVRPASWVADLLPAVDLSSDAFVCPTDATEDGHDDATATRFVQVLGEPPVSVADDALVDDRAAFLFRERADLVLGASLPVDGAGPGDYDGLNTVAGDGGTLDAGMAVDSWLFHHEATADSRTVRTTVSFSKEVLGVMIVSDTLADADAVAGAAGTVYPVGAEGAGRGLDDVSDRLTIGADRRTISIVARQDDGFAEQVRVLVRPGGGAAFTSYGMNRHLDGGVASATEVFLADYGRSVIDLDSADGEVDGAGARALRHDGAANVLMGDGSIRQGDEAFFAADQSQW